MERQVFEKFLNSEKSEWFNEDVMYLNDISAFQGEQTFSFVEGGIFAYLLVDEGELEFELNGKKYRAKSRDLALLSHAHSFRVVRMIAGARCRALFVDQSLYGQVVFTERLYYQFLLYRHPVFSLGEDEWTHLSGCVEQILQRLRAREHYYQKGAVQLAVFMFMIELGNLIRHHLAAHPVSQTSSDQVFRDFVSLVARHFKAEHSVTFYAEKLNRSPQNLSRIVKRITQMTASDFIYERLYQEARLLLHRSEYSIQQVADKLCFSDQSAFGKFFRSRSGETPSAFREKHYLSSRRKE